MVYYQSVEGKSVRSEDMVQSPVDSLGMMADLLAEPAEKCQCKLVDKFDRPSMC